MEFTENYETEAPETVETATAAPAKKVGKKNILIIIGVFAGIAIIMLAMKKSKKEVSAPQGGATKKDQPFQIVVNNHGNQPLKQSKPKKAKPNDLEAAIVDGDENEENETEKDEV